MSAKVLVVAAHPDDEVLGCGATMAHHAQKGDAVDILFMAEGSSSRAPLGETVDFSADIEKRKNAAIEAAQILGARTPIFIEHPNLRMRDGSMLDYVKQVEAVINDTAPDIIYTHHAGDMNSDHRIVFEAVLTACRPIARNCPSTIYSFEVPSSTEWSDPAIGGAFIPQYFVDVSSLMERKFEALSRYDDELRPPPHPRSREYIEALARVRGGMVGALFAEAFMVVRHVTK